MRAGVRSRLAMIAALGGLALAGAPAALADPIPLAPDDEDSFTARVDRIAFQASTTDILAPYPGRMNFYVARVAETGSNGVLSRPIDSFFAGPDAGNPPVYEARPDPDTSWPNRPGTYYWQAVYHNCAFADPNCFGPIRSLTIEPLPPPSQTSPADDATIPYGGEATFSLQDVPSYRRVGTRISIEFSKSTDRRPDGTFANQYLVARPAALGEGVYEYGATEEITERAGTYYWIVERFDCSAEADCYVTDGEIRSFTVAPPVPGLAPNTSFTRHPPRRTRKRRVRFAFSSSIPGATFQCFYTGGWSTCRSPQRFRRLKPGRYRFKVRAVVDGRRDPTPATWWFRVLRRRLRSAFGRTKPSTRGGTDGPAAGSTKRLGRRRLCGRRRLRRRTGPAATAGC